jgi:hypothetical protein
MIVLPSVGREIYGTSACPAIFMHANFGITFDLKAIREDLPQDRYSF